MRITEFSQGRPVYHWRAETWECDIHRHWSTQFYCRAFEAACHSAGVLTVKPADQIRVKSRHLRFHREVLEGDALRICAFMTRHEGQPLLAQFMLRNDQLIATSLDDLGGLSLDLPELPAGLAQVALPRGIARQGIALWPFDAERDVRTELGPVAAVDLADAARGALGFGAAFERMSFASQHHMGGLGYTADYTRSHHIGRMVAEMHYRNYEDAAVGDVIRGVSRVTALREKSFVASHMLQTQHGTPVASFDICMLLVDLEARRVVAVPEFLRQSAGKYLTEA